MSGSRSPKWRGVAAISLLAVGVATLVLSWPDAAVEKPAVEVPVAQPKTRVPPPPLQNLDRAALIDAASLAASAFAAGDMTDAKFRQFAGRRFELVLPFACNGPIAREEKLDRGWSYDSENGNFQLVFPSNIVLPLVDEAQSVDDTEPATRFAKSFWIERDWLRQGVCPRIPDTSVMTGTAEAPSLAIAEIADEESPRADDRDGQPYRVSKRLTAEQLPDKQGLRVVITGRLASSPKLPFQCKSVHPDRRPICVILGRFDRLQITNASGSETYGEWRG